jgi:hypothetical protein
VELVAPAASAVPDGLEVLAVRVALVVLENPVELAAQVALVAPESLVAQAVLANPAVREALVVPVV